MRNRGRPPKPLDPNASPAARLGAELRARRVAKGLTLQAMSQLIGYSPQHMSEIERANTAPSECFIIVCDRELHADGALLALFPDVARARTQASRERDSARRNGLPALPCDPPHPEVGEDVDPVNRRGLLGATAGAAIGLSGAAPAAAREIDPELPVHWGQLLNLLGRHDAMFGPKDVLTSVRREVDLIEEHRRIARGSVQTDLMRIESRWAQFAAWLSNDTGQARNRDMWTERARRLAHECGYRDMVAFARMRQSQWAAQDHDAPRAIALAEASLRVPGTTAQTRTICALRAALGHALAGDTGSTESRLAEAHALVARDSPAPPWAGEIPVTENRHVRTGEARCWLWLKPSKAIPMYEVTLRDWPRTLMRDGGLHQARLAYACAAAGEQDRAEAEGRKALAIARTTKSNIAARELRQLGAALAEEQ